MEKSLVTCNGLRFNTTVNTFLVRMDKLEKVTASGIIIPDTAQKRTDFTGVVVAISRGEEKNGLIKLGDRVVVSKETKRVLPTDDTKNEFRLYNKKELILCTTSNS